MYKVIVAGGREFTDYKFVKAKLDKILSDKKKVEIVSGRARGTDRMGERYARERKLGLKKFPADWNTYGKRAGFLRNSQMGEYADACVCFWDGESTGTGGMIKIAKQRGLDLRIIRI